MSLVRHFRRLLLIGLSVLPSATAGAEVVRVNVTSRRPLLGGRIFGRTGAYELILGTIDYAVDPASPHNSLIVDLNVAPRNAAGRVEFSGDVVILRPVDASHGNSITLIDVVNRGGRTVLGTFNLATGGGDLSSAAEVGDGLLLERGYTIVFLGWEFDVASGLKLRVPTAPGIKGIAHGLYVAADTGRRFIFSDLNGYAPVDVAASSTALTVRKGANGMATVLPRESWQLTGNTVTLAAPAQPGRWYELSYEAVNPPIAGLGFAAVRDVAAWTKSSKNALARSTSVLAYGNSQCGRFLRDFLYEGFNTDETNHQALDAVFANVAGASRIDLNRRWATPVSQGYGTATSFPFADTMQRDPLSLAADGELENGTASLRDMPKIFYTNTGVEYWGGARAAALIHTTPDGARDVPVPQNVRIYFNAGAQHGPGAFPPAASMGQAFGNPTDYRLTMRALLMSMEEWMHGAISPPPSRYPRIDDGTLVRVSGIGFPALPEAATLRTLTGGRRVKSPFLPDGAAAGALLPLLVPQVDADGNELAGIRLPEVAVPLATYTGWNFRGAQAGASDELFPLLGSYLPFATTKAARLLTGDPRRSVAERYESKVRYLARVRDAADELVRSRYLRAEDVDRVMQRAADHWELRAH